jgi:hypothetical protein
MGAALVSRWARRLAAAAVRLRALAFVGRTVKAPQLLPQSFNLAFIAGFLSLGLFEQFEHLIELIQRVPQRGDDGHDFVNRIADGRRLRGLRRTGGTMSEVFLALARRLRPGGLTRCFGGLVGNFHFRRCREKAFVVRRAGFATAGGRGIRWRMGRVVENITGDFRGGFRRRR